MYVYNKTADPFNNFTFQFTGSALDCSLKRAIHCRRTFSENCFVVLKMSFKRNMEYFFFK